MAHTLKPLGGYLTITEPDRPRVERDTIACGHCQRVVWVKPRSVSTVYLQFNRAAWQWEEVPGAFCAICMRPICLTCHAHGRCLPWERMLAISEGKDRLTRTVFASFQPTG
jgi:hypothetical protein